MMYHFIFGFLSGASVAGAASAGTSVATGAGSPAACSAMLSSVLVCSSAICSALPMGQAFQQLVEAFCNDCIDDPEIKPEQEHGNNDHGRRALHFLARRRRDLLHLRAHVVIKTLRALRPLLERSQAPFVYRFDRC